MLHSVKGTEELINVQAEWYNEVNKSKLFRCFVLKAVVQSGQKLIILVQPKITEGAFVVSFLVEYKDIQKCFTP